MEATTVCHRRRAACWPIDVNTFSSVGVLRNASSGEYHYR